MNLDKSINLWVTLPKPLMITSTDADQKVNMQLLLASKQHVSIRGWKTPSDSSGNIQSKSEYCPGTEGPPLTRQWMIIVDKILDARPCTGRAATSKYVVTTDGGTIQTDKLVVVNHLEDNAFFIILWGLVSFPSSVLAGLFNGHRHHHFARCRSLLLFISKRKTQGNIGWLEPSSRFFHIHKKTCDVPSVLH